MTIHRHQRNWGCRVHETNLFGIRTIVLENELIRISILAGKGTDVVEFNYKPLDLDFVWLAPAGIRNPLALYSTSPDLLATFIDFYPGGWQEIFPNAGASAQWAGATYGQHGEVFALPWDVSIEEDSEESVAVKFSIRGIKTPCDIEKVIRLKAGVPAIEIDEVMTNRSLVPFDAMWGHHITFGKPFLTPGSKISVPDGLTAIPHGQSVEGNLRRIGSVEPFSWPVGINPAGQQEDFSIVPGAGAPSELFYLSGFPEATAWYEITQADSPLGMRVEWDRAALPYLWYWQEFGATETYPWYGRNWNIGLEPSSSYPTNGLPDAVENGSALRIEPGESKSLHLKASIIGGR